MNRTDAVRWLGGWVRFETTTAAPERLLDGCARYELPLWEITRDGLCTTGCCALSTYRRMRYRPVRGGVRPRVVARRGLPFLLRRIGRRVGLIIGCAAVMGLFWWLGGRIWVIDVQGNVTLTTEKIAEVAASEGVTVGTAVKDLDIERFRLALPGRLDALAWATVNPEGCIAHIVVTERETPPDLLTRGGCSDLVAACDGVVVRALVHAGQLQVKPGEAVAKGDLLVAGRVPTDRGDLTYRSVGEVFAEIEETLTVRIPLAEVLPRPTGKTVCRPTLCLFGIRVPLYASGTGDPPAERRTVRHFLTARGCELPLGLSVETLFLTDPLTVTHTEAEAVALADAQLAAMEKEAFADAERLAEKVSGGVENGMYVLTGRYKVVRNIAEEVFWPDEGGGEENFVQIVQ